MLASAFVWDEDGSHIDTAQLAASFAVVHNAAAADAAASVRSSKSHAAADHIEALVNTEIEAGPSWLLRCTVQKADDPQRKAAPSLWEEHLLFGASRRTAGRSHLAGALILGEAGSGRLIARGKDVCHSQCVNSEG